MLTNSRFVSRLSPLAIAISLAGCGGGGGGGSSSAPITTTPPPAVPLSVLASGVVTGFSSVFVNGVRYEVENGTLVSVEGEEDVSGDDTLLRMGMKVRVQARETSGTRVAEHIEYDDDLKGPARDVTSNAADPGIGSFTVMRQSVFVDANTLFDNNIGDNNGDGAIDIRDLTLPAGGEVVVAVSGLPTSDGYIATRIERENSAAGIPDVADDEFEVKGFVDAVAADGSSFSINNAIFLVVEGAGGTVFDDGLTAGASLVGVFVEVKADEDANGDLIARKVERDDDIGDRNDDGRFDDDDRDGRFEIKGILVSVDMTSNPDVVVIGNTTLEVVDASALIGREGTLLELKGNFDDNGVLTLDTFEQEQENTIRTEDRVSSVSTSAGTITTRLGLVISPTGGSRVEDDVSDDDDHLTPQQFLDRVMENDYLEARGFHDDNGSVIWTRIEREDSSDMECRLRGPVATIDGSSATDFSFTIQGVTIVVSGITSDGGFKGNDDQPLGRQAFFDQLDVGDVVEAQSDDAGLGCEDARLNAREVEFQADDDVIGSGSDDDGTGDGNDAEISGTPTDVGASSFLLNGDSITVVGSTLIDDSIIERALGRELDGDDRRFDQVPDGLTLQQLLPGTFAIQVVLNSDGIALLIEDL